MESTEFDKPRRTNAPAIQNPFPYHTHTKLQTTMVRTSTKATILAAVMATIALLQGVQAYPRSELRLPRSFFRGEPNCALALDGWDTDLEVNYLVPLDKLITYPCSFGYLKNFAANPDLLHDVIDAVNEQGETEGANECADKCDFNNGIVNTVELSDDTFDQDSFEDILSSSRRYRRQYAYFCNTDTSKGELGALNKLWDKKVASGDKPDRNGESACQCKQIPGETNARSFDWGCSRCIGKVKVGVSHCYDFLD